MRNHERNYEKLKETMRNQERIKRNKVQPRETMREI